MAPDRLESELFGRVDEDSDGAGDDGRGRFELADGGTLFLDDIGAMPLPLQFKLLRVLRERVFERVNGDTPRYVNIRIIAATHHDLDALVAANRFREDLHDSLKGAAAISRPSTAHSHPDGLDLERYLADMERSLIRQALGESGGELAQAAERLNLGRAALVEKMRKCGI